MEIKLGKEYKFKCERCNSLLDRKGNVCCRCLIFSKERAIEKTKAELRAITLMVRQENPELLKKLKQEAREIAISKVSREYGMKPYLLDYKPRG